ncbi:MAG TPA: archaellin/type IV pilin N-terminal domain-containing protein [Candidatus Krumholzibacteriaceae bacterium]|nr:archaellin/type IV pilin N-terminal domain-containing protein [Candidatus Krumholzibacteriaceae bacterium]
MTAIKKLSKRRALSPVIATVILVAVAITVAVGVSYWMSGIAGQYTAFEKVEITSVVITSDDFGNWILTTSLKNSGSASATIDSIFVNDGSVTIGVAAAPIAAVNTITSGMAATGLTLESGESTGVTPILVWVGADYAELSSGTTVNLKLHSAGGMDYIKLIKLV